MSFIRNRANQAFNFLNVKTRYVGRSLYRKKDMHVEPNAASQLDRCMSTLDLTFLGIGSTLGLGVYVIAGQVAATSSGPAVMISFLIAAIASVFAGLCYAEFGSRVPRAGSAYIYSYVTVGEFVAFIIGWNLILEYVIGTASVARGYSSYIDSLFNGTMKHHLRELLPMDIPYMSTYPDFLSLGISLLLTVVLAIGVKESTKFNNIFTCLNLLIVLYVVICGLFKADIHNWQLSKDEVPPGAGEGGFIPYGLPMMMTGASTCFYAFVGFDCVATSGEEVRNPQRAIPISIIASLTVVFFAYFGVSSVTTLMWPYYDLRQDAPLPYVFKMVGWNSAKWIISIGALAGLSTSLLGAMFPLPRVLYAMASDGVIFRFIAYVHPRFKTPLIATCISGVFSGTMAMLFNVDDLAKMMSIGTLQAYSLVAISVLFLRYRIKMETVAMHSPVPVSPTTPHSYVGGSQQTMSTSVQMSSSVMISLQQFTSKEVRRQIFNADNHTLPTQLSSRISTYLILLIIALGILFDGFLVIFETNLGSVASLVCLCSSFFFLALSCYALWRQPQAPANIKFKTPLMPFTPIASVIANAYLMLKLESITWIRFAVWLTIGLLVYFGYGVWNSSERKDRIQMTNSQSALLDHGNSDSEFEAERHDHNFSAKTETSPLVH